MKLLIVLCAVAATAFAVKQEKYKLRPESLSKLRNTAMTCAKEFNVDPETINHLGDNTLPRDDATNKFLHCFAVNSGLVDKDGLLILDKLVTVVKDHPRVEEFREALQKCVGVSKENPVATTLAAHICYCENSPILVDLVM